MGFIHIKQIMSPKDRLDENYMLLLVVESTKKYITHTKNKTTVANYIKVGA